MAWFRCGGGVCKPYVFMRTAGQHYINESVHAVQWELGDSNQFGTGTLKNNGTFTATKDFTLDLSISSTTTAITFAFKINGDIKTSGTYTIKNGDTISMYVDTGTYTTFQAFALIAMY